MGYENLTELIETLLELVLVGANGFFVAAEFSLVAIPRAYGQQRWSNDAKAEQRCGL